MIETLLERLTEKGDLKMKTRNQIYLIAALFLALMFADAVVDVVAKESQSAEIQTSEQAGPDNSVAYWLEEAEASAVSGNSAYMETYFTRAKWCVEDIDIPEEIKTAMLKNIYERAEAARPRGYRGDASDELTSALLSAHSGFKSQVQYSLKRYKFYCLKAGVDPDGKIKKVMEILVVSLAERKKLLEN